MIIGHETNTLPNPLHTFIATLCSTGIDCSNPVIILHSIACKTCLATVCMVMSMHLINEKTGVLEVACLSNKAVRSKLTGTVIDNDFWCIRKSGVNCREDIISAFCNRNCMESETHRVCTPQHQDSTNEIILWIGFVKFVAVPKLVRIMVNRLRVML